jgi:hypothetical protein
MVSWREGPSGIQGYLDDYAFFQAAQLDLFESTFNPAYLRKALELEGDMMRLFWDGEAGGFYFNGSDQKDAHRLLARAKEAYDGVIPSGNSVAALNGYRLAEFTGKREYRDRADAILKCFARGLVRSGANFPAMLQAFQFDFYGSAEVFVTGPRSRSEAGFKEVWKAFLPHKVLAFAEEKDAQELAALLPWVQGRKALDGKPTFYVCRNYQCQLPTTDAEKALELLGQK